MEAFNNVVHLCGSLGGKPEFSHNGRKGEYYTFPIDIMRLSGTIDTVNIIARKELLEGLEIEDGSCIGVNGELRSFNNKSGEGNRLVITVFAKELFFTDGENKNMVAITGTLCKPPNLRRTPMGRQICDLMVAANRRYGHSDYLPCIVWGRLAESAAALTVGDSIKLEGRIQSRKYIKMEDGVMIEHTAFEVSVVSIVL